MTRHTTEPTITTGPKEGLDGPATLRAAADLIEPEGRWTQTLYARNKSGRGVHPTSRSAICWCALGALERANPSSWWPAQEALAYSLGGVGIIRFNDQEGRTQAEVVAALRAAADQAAAASPTTKGS